MIQLKTAHDVEAMRRAGKITAAARALAGEMVKPGVSTRAIDKAVHDFITSGRFAVIKSEYFHQCFIFFFLEIYC